MKTECGKLKIAGDFTVDDWNSIKEILKPGKKNPNNWKLAYKVFFKTRLETRYFTPINLLIRQLGKAGEGFSIVTLQCSLIEFLASTIEGKSYRYRSRGKTTKCGKHEYCYCGECGEHEYCDSIKLFETFLIKRTPFNNYIKNPTQADKFYKDVRCALLHDARTKGGWKIRAECKSAPPIAIDVKKRIVYRNNLQSDFEKFVDWYGENLPKCEKLQEAFKRKFDSLCCE